MTQNMWFTVERKEKRSSDITNIHKCFNAFSCKVEGKLRQTLNLYV